MTNAVQNYLNDMLAAFDARATYERSKNAENDNMQKTLKDLRASVAHVKIAEIMSACNVNAQFINRAERNNARFNVYSAEKVVNVARAIASVNSLNHYTKAIYASILSFANAKLDFSHKDAIAACSLSVKCSDTKRAKALVQYQKHVAANTASTQASSSLNALLQYRVIEEYRDAANNVCYRAAQHEYNDKLKELCA